MEKHLVIWNPQAGGGRFRDKARKLINQLQESGVEIEIRETKRAGDGSLFAKDAYSKGQRNFIAVGGDGTVFEILNGLFPLAKDKKNNRPYLGLIPLGTGNSFLRDFTDQGSDYSIKAIIQDKHRPCDVIQLTHKNGVVFFINILSIGFSADVGLIRNRYFRHFGEAGYVMATLTKVANLRSKMFSMRIDDGAKKQKPLLFICINNSRYTGGKMMMSPKADTSDGYADLLEAHPISRLELLKLLPKVYDGSHIQHPSVTTERVQSVEFDFENETNVLLDGEILHLLPKRLDVLPQALEVRV